MANSAKLNVISRQKARQFRYHNLACMQGAVGTDVALLQHIFTVKKSDSANVSSIL